MAGSGCPSMPILAPPRAAAPSPEPQAGVLQRGEHLHRRGPQPAMTVPCAPASADLPCPAGVPGTAVPPGRAVCCGWCPVCPQRPPALCSVRLLPWPQAAARHGPVPLYLRQCWTLLQGTTAGTGGTAQGSRVSAILWCQPLGTFLLLQPADQFNGQSTGFSTYSQAAINGVSLSSGGGGGQCRPGWVLKVHGASAARPVAARVPQLTTGWEPHAAHDARKWHPPLHIPGSGCQVALPARHEAQCHLPAPIPLG